MNSEFFADNYRLRLLRLLKCCVHEIVCLDIKRKFLLTECDEWKKVSYKTKTTRYKNAAGVVVNYKNTSAFIVSRNQKVKVKNYDDIKLQIELEMLKEIDLKYTMYTKMAGQYCNSLNSLREAGKDNYDIDLLKKVTINEINASKEDVFIVRSLNFDLMESKNSPEFDNSFCNYIVSCEDERFRSKNELLASICMQNCGLSYCLEPLYPNSGLRADFGVFCSISQKNGKEISYYKKPRQIFVEITGMRTDKGCDEKLKYKKQIAKQNKIPLVIIDMTDYPDDNGKLQTRLDCKHLCNIFTKLYFGYIPANGEILLPYDELNN